MKKKEKIEVGKCWNEVTREALVHSEQNPWVACYCDGSVDSCRGPRRFRAVRHRTLARCFCVLRLTIGRHNPPQAPGDCSRERLAVSERQIGGEKNDLIPST